MSLKKADDNELSILAEDIRYNCIRSIFSAGGGHVGGSLSICEALAALYGSIMKYYPDSPDDPGRDKVVLSKGHCGPALYSALALSGFFPKEELLTLNKDGGHLPSHCDMNKTPGIDMTTGSLGQGASTAVGMALGKKLLSKGGNIFLILGDGEINEGQVWEAAMFASQNKLDNLIAFVDLNHQQLDGYTKDIIDVNISAAFKAFGWETVTVNGKDAKAIKMILEDVITKNNGAPKCIILDTVKGQGWSIVEGKTGIHHMVISEEMMEEAKKEFSSKGVQV